ncbi:MAG: DNA adenine methylase [Cyanobacteria bacterium NC_groundwater_1444_Ag_S-0.65um_54_12]|nr:DNA adenine methylase [Cyanobacteria bacterium NC_groundwater_1444_Ag_S-0.65um_54_12]
MPGSAWEFTQVAGTILRLLAPETGRLAVPRPFLKWVGGKGQLLGELVRRFDIADPSGCYHEPFVGGGALFFELVRTGRLKGAAFLSDANPNLIEAYKAVRDTVDDLIELLVAHTKRHSEKYYYEVRAKTPKTPEERAARLIYLNKTCFNGLYRENSKGEFNVPFGKYENPTICDESNLRAVAKALQLADISVRTFASVLELARAGDFVYFDPPYYPLSKTSSFTSYSKDGFGDEGQRQLASTALELSNRGAFVLLSNSSAKFIYQLYQDFQIEEVLANRAINSNATRRGKIPEVLVNNYLGGGKVVRSFSSIAATAGPDLVQQRWQATL